MSLVNQLSSKLESATVVTERGAAIKAALLELSAYETLVKLGNEHGLSLPDEDKPLLAILKKERAAALASPHDDRAFIRLQSTTEVVWMAYERELTKLVSDWVAWTNDDVENFGPKVEYIKANIAIMTRLSPNQQAECWHSTILLGNLKVALRLLEAQGNVARSAMRLLVKTIQLRSPEMMKDALSTCLGALKAFSSFTDSVKDDYHALDHDSTNAKGYIDSALRKKAQAEGRFASERAQIASSGEGTPSDHASYFSSEDSFESISNYYPSVNPSTGLPMIEGSGVDVSGHAYGTGEPGGDW